ncbi:hypothetical protein M413DRAFT_77989 [Hebeloma cylindrosporum]|uniref:CoA-transferase family III n=1 Tax=Hebeloma cylindrosporum TaxID=76867 RepID=A0A0C2XFM6_HEBCY|nr:hypothetical protein M413DRAFT_77989 [Hebeloma cylindrosporum h7]
MPTNPTYSVPRESHILLHDGILSNPLHTPFLPPEIKDAAKSIEFIGSSEPSIPINWRFAESISAIKGFQAAMLNVLLKKKYGVEYQKVVINTDHAQLFIMSVMLPVIDPLGAKIRLSDREGWYKYYPDGDKHHVLDGGNFVSASTNIYKTKDGRFFHLHGSLNAVPIQRALSLSSPPASEGSLSFTDACSLYQTAISQYTASELESLMDDTHRQAGTTCWSTTEYLSSPHGKANAHVGLYEVHHIPSTYSPKAQEPMWWTPFGLSEAPHEAPLKTSARRPLLGLKVLDLTRIIASPTITRELAELGASVLRITSPNVPDMTALLADLGWGKWNAHLDLTRLPDRERLRALILESDVVVDGYRPGVMEKWGFGKEDILTMFEGKKKGVVYVRENCYGWNGPWMGRSGWQQISDANCGVSLEFGRAMGNDEPVTPIFPNSDYCTGVAGATGVLQALLERAEKGGSFVVDVALNYYSQWLINTCSTYPPQIWDQLWEAYDRPILRHTDNMGVTLYPLIKKLTENPLGARIFNPDFFELRENKAIGVPIQTVKPILGFPEGVVELGYNIGSRGNGVDEARWPEDLLTEIIKV